MAKVATTLPSMNGSSGDFEDGVSPGASKSADAPAKTVLFVDDDDGLREILALHLESRGFRVLTASDGAVAFALASEELPDVAILDIVMPGMNGWELARRLRENPKTSRIRLLMLSGIGEELLGANLEVLGGDLGLDKPFELDELDEAIRSLLRNEPAGPYKTL